MDKPRRLRVGVIYGGRSSEHEVSLSSAQNVMNALREAGHVVVPIGIAPSGRWLTGEQVQMLGAARSAESVDQDTANSHEEPDRSQSWELLPQNSEDATLPEIDVIFPVLHGPYGEDGTVQGLLEMAGIAYVGCGVLSSAAAMDKSVAKTLISAAGIEQTPSLTVMRTAWETDSSGVIEGIEAQLNYAFFVKPANLGSSIGITKARNRAELSQAIDTACLYDRKVVVEQAVPNAREIEVSVLGNDRPIASLPGEIVPGNEFYDYEAKYVDDTSRLIIPASLSEVQTEQIRDHAIRAFRAIEGSGLARVDFLLDDESGAVYFNEINTMPGFTRISMYPKLWEASGIGYAELVDRLIDLALERFADKERNVTTR